MSPDVNVTGGGLYMLQPLSRRGRAWCRRNLSDGDRTRLGDAVVCEGGVRCRAIVAGMVEGGLRVEVNGEVFAPRGAS